MLLCHTANRSLGRCSTHRARLPGYPAKKVISSASVCGSHTRTHTDFCYAALAALAKEDALAAIDAELGMIKDSEIDAMTFDQRKEQFVRLATTFLKSRTVGDAMPMSAKVIVFDVDLKVRHAFQGLVEHGKSCYALVKVFHSSTVVSLT